MKFSIEICFSKCEKICKEKIRFLLEVQNTYSKFIQIFSGVHFEFYLKKAPSQLRSCKFISQAIV